MPTLPLRILALLTCTALVAPLHAAPSATKPKAVPAVSTAPPPKAKTVDTESTPSSDIAAESTPVKVVVQQELKSGDSKEGQDVLFSTSTDVYSAAHILLVPAGSKAWGIVRKSSGHGAWGKAGKLDFSCDYLVAPNGTKVPLRSQSLAVQGKNNTNALVGGILALGVFGGFVKGRDVKIEKGAEFTMYIDQSTQLPAISDAGRATVPHNNPTVQPVSSTTKNSAPASLTDMLADQSHPLGAVVGRKVGIGE
ncbi:MAG TPA: hypothetical protein VGK19_00090 [Capsulimonadaceae bacterium]